MFLGKYGVARHIYIPIPKAGSANHAVSADWTPGAGDVKISKDGGAAANVTNLPTAIAMGNSTVWDFSLTATEMQAAQVNVTVADSATKAVDDTGFIIETYGNASAQHAFDLGTASTAQTGDSFARIGAAGAGLTAIDLPDQTMNITGNITGNLSGSVGSVTGAVGSVTGAVGSVTGAVGSVTGAVGSVSGNVGGNVVGTVGSVVGAVGSVTGNVGGNVTGSVGSVAVGGIGATAFAAGAIDAAAIAANAIGASELDAGAIDEIWDELIGDSTVTARQAMRAFMASLAGKLSGAATATVVIRNVADDKDRITATVDADGNRSAITLDLT